MTSLLVWLEGRHMSVDLLDDLEAGELSVAFEGEEPEVVLAWAIEQFSPRISISTAFQTDGAVLLHMAYAIDPSIRIFSVDTGRLPSETFFDHCMTGFEGDETPPARLLWSSPPRRPS